MRKTVYLVILFVLVIATGAGYWFYFNRYGDDYREGILYSFQRKGNVLKPTKG